LRDGGLRPAAKFGTQFLDAAEQVLVRAVLQVEEQRACSNSLAWVSARWE
jgi:hypothetical protein